MKKVRVKPSKFSSAIAGVIGIIFVIFGITQISVMGIFGVVWTLGATGVTGYHLYNLFSSKGAGVYEIDIHEQQEDFDAKLRKLDKLYQDGIISKEEYEIKKAEILNSKW